MECFPNFLRCQVLDGRDDHTHNGVQIGLLALGHTMILYCLVQLPVGCPGAMHNPWACSQGWGKSHNDLTPLY